MASRLKVAFRDFLRTIHQFWLEVSGVMFIALAVVFGFQAVDLYGQYDSMTDLLVLASAAILSLLTLGFGIHSLWKSRKLR